MGSGAYFDGISGVHGWSRSQCHVSWLRRGAMAHRCLRGVAGPAAEALLGGMGALWLWRGFKGTGQVSSAWDKAGGRSQLPGLFAAWVEACLKRTLAHFHYLAAQGIPGLQACRFTTVHLWRASSLGSGPAQVPSLSILWKTLSC